MWASHNTRNPISHSSHARCNVPLWKACPQPLHVLERTIGVTHGDWHLFPPCPYRDSEHHDTEQQCVAPWLALLTTMPSAGMSLLMCIEQDLQEKVGFPLRGSRCQILSPPNNVFNCFVSRVQFPTECQVPYWFIGLRVGEQKVFLVYLNLTR